MRKQGGGCHGESVGHVRVSADARSGNKSSLKRIASMVGCTRELSNVVLSLNLYIVILPFKSRRGVPWCKL